MLAASISPMFTWNWGTTCYTTSKTKLITLDFLFITVEMQTCLLHDMQAWFWNWNFYISQMVDLLSSIYYYFNRHVCDNMGTWALIFFIFKNCYTFMEKSFDTVILLLQLKSGILTWKKSCKAVNEAKSVCVGQLQIFAMCPYYLSTLFNNYLKLF